MTRRALHILLAVLGGVACAPELEPISEITTLRVLGVRKSAPFAHPGESVTLQLRWEDGRAEPPGEVATFFGFWCLNPPGDSYAQCLTSGQPSTPPQVFFDEETVTVQIPEDALRDQQPELNLPPYGTAFVFFAVCAGKLDVGVLDSTDNFEGVVGQDLLPRCVDEDGTELGAKDFIVGYSRILIYEELRNNNPIVTGFEVEGRAVDIDCIDEKCQEPLAVPELDDCVEGGLCIDTCDDDGEFTCPEVRLGAVVDEQSAEPDELAFRSFGTELEESLWVSYFVDRGAISSPLKLINDSRLGWQADFATGFFAPKDAGPLRVWAVVRDSRGGAAWVRVAGYVRER